MRTKKGQKIPKAQRTKQKIDQGKKPNKNQPPQIFSRSPSSSAGIIFMVATPIGNLKDMSQRTIEVFEKVDGILCEDTRRTSHLMSHLGLSRSLFRVDQHTPDRELSHFVNQVLGGKNYAYVSDAGTPSVSDPGARLVELCFQVGVLVSPIPGPSAVTALISVSGFQENSFTFDGFFPRKASSQKECLKRAQQRGGVSVWFESPERIEETFSFLRSGVPDLNVVVAKELTKLHEKIFRGPVSQIASHIQSELQYGGIRGEWVFAVNFGGAASEGGHSAGDLTEEGISSLSSDWEKCLEVCLACDVPLSRMVKEISQSFGVPKNKVYASALELAKSQKKT